MLSKNAQFLSMQRPKMKLETKKLARIRIFLSSPKPTHQPNPRRAVRLDDELKIPVRWFILQAYDHECETGRFEAQGSRLHGLSDSQLLGGYVHEGLEYLLRAQWLHVDVLSLGRD